MLRTAVKKIESAMFPIFRLVQLNPQQSNVGVVGTGFFVNDSGVFVTVAHIFDNSPPEASFLYIGQS